MLDELQTLTKNVRPSAAICIALMEKITAEEKLMYKINLAKSSHMERCEGQEPDTQDADPMLDTEVMIMS